MFFGTVRHYPANVYEVFLRECQLDEDGERKIQGMTGSTILRMPKFKTEISTKFGFENTVSLESTDGSQKGFGNQLPRALKSGKVQRSSTLKLVFEGTFSSGFNDKMEDVKAGAALDLIPFLNKPAKFLEKMNRLKSFSAGGLKIPFYISQACWKLPYQKEPL